MIILCDPWGWPDYFLQTNDLMRLRYSCRDHRVCADFCYFEDECWWALECCGYLCAKEWVEHYFEMIYSEGEV